MKTRFWNVDTQHDFMRREGALYVAGAEAIEPNLTSLTQLADQEGIVVVNTADYHTCDSTELSDTPDFRNTFPPHCLQGTPGVEFVPATKPQAALYTYCIDWKAKDVDSSRLREARNIVLYKDAFDVFAGNRHTDRVVSELGDCQYVVYGVATNVCVDFAVRGLLERGYDVVVPIDAIKGLPNLPEEDVLKRWEAEGAILTRTSDIKKYIRRE
ncbi:TPA: cysteine hydrolase [Candidatus Woesearchaeota archaeon]|nr:cysteine hydrolase [Candidatus Woesearchaeota archaeon]